MSLHIIKCKTILKINEIETINLTQYLNFHRHTETGGNSMCMDLKVGKISGVRRSAWLKQSEMRGVWCRMRSEQSKWPEHADS